MKQAKDIMTTNPACCMPENSVEEAAQMMVRARLRRDSRGREQRQPEARRCHHRSRRYLPRRGGGQESAASESARRHDESACDRQARDEH